MSAPPPLRSILRPVEARPFASGAPTEPLVPVQQVVTGHAGASDFTPLARQAAAQAATASPSLPLPAAGLHRGSHGGEVLKLQRALRQLGLMSRAQIATGPGVFGPRTEHALAAFQTKHHLPQTGVFDAPTRAALAQALGHARPPTQPAVGEPAHDYRQVSFRGVTLDARTREMIHRAEAKLKAMGAPMQLTLTQGSFSHSVAASGSTHHGGGAVDIRTRGHSPAVVDKMVKALRAVGFAAWSRGRGHDNFAPHIHAIAIGDRRLSSGARWQVGQYFAGRSGLTSGGADADGSLGRHGPAWAAKYR